MYKESIDSYYTAVMRCVTHACEESLPVRQVSCVNDFVVPGLDGMNMCRVSIEMLEMHFWHGSW
jgi:hypothetical protein